MTLEARRLHTAQEVVENYKKTRSYFDHLKAAPQKPEPVYYRPAPTPEVKKPAVVEIAVSKEPFSLPPRKYPKVERIQQVVCEYFKVTHNDLLSNRRSPCYTHPRNIAYYLSKELTLHSYPQIARQFNDRDHTTIMNGAKKIAKLRMTDRGLDFSLNELVAILVDNGDK